MLDIIRPTVNFIVLGLTVSGIIGLAVYFHRPIINYLRNLLQGSYQGWNTFWFASKDPTTLGAVRFCTGAVLFYIHICCAAELLSFIGPQGWIDADAAHKIQNLKARTEFDKYTRISPDNKQTVIYERTSLQGGAELVRTLRNRPELSPNEQDKLQAVEKDLWRIVWQEGMYPEDRSRLLEMKAPIGAAVAKVNDEQLNDRWADASQTMSVLAGKQPDRWFQLTNGVVGQSIWFYIQDPTAIVILHSVFLIATFCFMIGLFSRTTSIIVWIGHLSYIWRGYNTWFGMDTIILMLTFYMMFGPTGAALSVDRLIRRFRESRARLRAGKWTKEDTGPQPSWGANMVIRMMQIHMCIIYFASGCAKLQGHTWWNGSAIWMTMVTSEFALFDMTWLGALEVDWPWQMVSAGGVVMTILFEIGFPFLIWNARFRPLVLFVAFMLHAGIGLFMGLGGFGAIMLTGCMAFVPPTAMRWFVERLFKGWSGFQFGFNPANPAQFTAARWIYSADVWHQVELVNNADRGQTIPGGALITPNHRELHGMNAFGQLFRSLRVMWLLWPLAAWSFRGLRPDAKRPHWKPHSTPQVTQAPQVPASG